MSSDFSKAMVSGTVSGALSVVAGQPLDTIRIRMQTNPERFGSIGRTLLSTVKEERLITLYKGVAPALTSATIENAVVFTANSQIESIYKKYRYSDEPKGIPLSNSESALIGGFAGIFSAIAISPPELIKVRMQADIIRENGSRLYRNNLDCLMKTTRESGITGLFRSLPAQLARDIPFNFAFFGSYATFISALISYREIPNKELLRPVDLILAGGFAGVVGWTVSIPMDVIKSTVSCLPKSKYMVIEATKSVYNAEGLKGFFKGWTAAALRSFPTNGALFLGYEMSQRYLNRTF